MQNEIKLQIEYLTNALGFSIEEHHNALFCIKDKQYWYVRFDNNQYIFRTYEEIFINLIKTSKFYVLAKIINNPYYGCKSLEEALIKKDFIA
jgi:hypothetical protein